MTMVPNPDDEIVVISNFFMRKSLCIPIKDSTILVLFMLIGRLFHDYLTTNH